MTARGDEKTRAKIDHYAALIVLDLKTAEVRRIDMWEGNNKDERRAFYESLLKITWLSPKVRRAIMEELGLSLRARNASFNHGVAVGLGVLIAEAETRLKMDGKRPRGGIHEAAVTEVADGKGMSVEAVKKRLQRHRRRPQK
jgi:hypothetical protein